MQINKVKISGILGIENLEFDAGKFNVASGQNGTGKTSFIESIKSVVKGGEDATLLRRGEEKGEIVLVMDDNTEIRKRVTDKTTTTTVERDGVKIKRPAEFIKALTDVFSVNPIDFIRAPKKQRVGVILEALPMTADCDRLSSIVGFEVKEKPGVHALDQISALYQTIYDERTGTNRAIKEKEATITQLAATLPEGETPDDIPEFDKSGLLAKLDSIDAKRDEEINRITDKLAGLRKEKDDRVEGIRSEFDQKIDDLQAKIDEIRAEIDDVKVARDNNIKVENDKFADVESKAATQRTKTLDNHAAERAGTAAQLAAIEADQNAFTRHQQTRENIAVMRDAADELKADANSQTRSLDELEAYKSELLSALPIDGLEVRDGEIYRHDIPFDRLNTGQQVEISVEIAKLRAGELGIVCVDGLELLDTEHFEAFRDQILESDLQLFVSKVTDDDFTVSAE